MSDQVVPVQLTRDGQNTAWGFRLLGGADVGLPLTIQRVCLGSPSEGELYRGDILLRIGDRDASQLTHQEAHDLIRKAGNQLSLLLHRIPGAPGCSTPVSPGVSGASFGQHPLASAGGNMFQPLPTTRFEDNRSPFAPEPQTLDEFERYETANEKRREKQAIVHQAYRTTPLIAPKAKSRHDMPMGSYLRHVQDPNWQKPTHPGATPVVNYVVRRKLEEAARTGPSPPPAVILGPSGQKDESVPVFHRQYNSPINMYSPQAVMDTMSGQTGLQPNSGAPSSGLLQKSPYRKHVFQDISQSPTYQMIHDGEWNDLRKSQLKEHRAVEDRVYNAPVGGADSLTNALGVPRGKILQSGSFNTLRTSLILGHSDF